MGIFDKLRAWLSGAPPTDAPSPEHDQERFRADAEGAAPARGAGAFSASPHDIESLPGFAGWLVPGRDPPVDAPEVILGPAGLGCRVSRPPADEARTTARERLAAHAAKHPNHVLIVHQDIPLAESSGARFDALRTAVVESGYP
jgi:hypothetical protein